jgi:hypothetical protein
MKLAALVAVAALGAAPSVFAANQIEANVPFAFHVGTKAMSAGTYDFKVDFAEDTVDVRGGSPTVGATALIITRLAARPHPGQNEHPHIVFDKVGDKYTLSEIWQPGNEGILVYATKGKHEHYVIHVTK